MPAAGQRPPGGEGRGHNSCDRRTRSGQFGGRLIGDTLDKINSAQPLHVHFDLSGVNFCDAAGLSAFLAADRVLGAAGGRLTLIQPQPPDTAATRHHQAGPKSSPSTDPPPTSCCPRREGRRSRWRRPCQVSAAERPQTDAALGMLEDLPAIKLALAHDLAATTPTSHTLGDGTTAAGWVRRAAT